MVTKTSIGIGLLMLILLSTGVVYVEWKDDAKLRVDNDRSTFYVPHDTMPWMWVVAGREQNKIYDGTSLMNRDTKNIKVETVYDTNTITIKRTTPYIRGPVIVDTYYLDGTIDDIELFPISHKVEVFNATGKYYKYEVRDLIYYGDSFKLDGKQTSMAFGRNMKVEWWDNYNLGWVYKSGSMYVKSDKLESDYEVFEVRLFDPEKYGYTMEIYLDGVNESRKYEYHTIANITANLTSCDYLCYQESTNVTTACGGLDTGTYYANTTGCGNDPYPIVDGSWSTGGSSCDIDSAMYINYSVPSFASSTSYWEIKDDQTHANFTINSSCWNDTTLQFRYYRTYASLTYHNYWQCYTGSAWLNVSHSTDPADVEAFEEAMNWESNECKLCVDVDDDINNISYSLGDKNYTCDINSVNFLYNISTLRENEFNDSTTATNISSTGGSVFISINNKTDLSSLELNITGFDSSGYPDNITIDTNQSGTPNIELLGELRGSKIYYNNFFYTGAEYTSLNVSRSTSGTKTIYMNITTSGFERTSTPVDNYTIVLNGFDIDANNEFYLNDEFINSTYIDNASTTSEHPFWLWDDFFTDTRQELYTSVTGNGEAEVDTTAQQFNGSSSSSSTCTSSSASDSDSAKMTILEQNISQYKRIEFYGYCYAAASSANPQGCYGSSVNADSSCKLVLTSSDTLDTSVDIAGGSITKGCSEGYSPGGTWCSVSGSVSGTYLLERVEDIDSATFTFKVYKDSAYQGTTSALSGDINLAYVGATSTACQQGACTGCSYCPGAGTTHKNIYDTIRYSGVANNYTENLTYPANTTVTSAMLYTGTDNISLATINARDYEPDNCTVSYYLSNDNASTWESAISTITHAFTSDGKLLRWKADINCTVTNNTAAIIALEIDVTPQSVTGIDIDVGADGDVDWNYSATLNSTNSPQTFSPNGTEIYDYVQQNCLDSTYCYVPTSVSYGSPGTIEFSSHNVTLEANPILLDTTLLEDFSLINLTLAFANGITELSNLKLDFFGSKNITFFSHFHNDTGFNDTQIMQVRYSKFNVSLPENVSYWEVFPTTKDDVNLTPYGQTNDTPIWNYSVQAYDDPVDAYIYVNESVNACMDISFSNTSTLSSSNVIITTSAQQIYSGLTEGDTFGMWNDIDLNDCSGRYYLPWFTFVGICSDCVKTASWWTEVNKVEE